jgi:glycosyltransferase involved in cell wall biosynthesis
VRVTYVLGHPTPGGGTKVVAQHAALLREAGAEVTLVAQGARPGWLPFDGPYVDSSVTPPRLPTQDIVIATFWTTLAIAARWAIGPVAHFCQGYEGRLGYLRADWPAIEAAYAVRAPTLTVTPDLATFLAQRFGRACRVARPPVDPLFRSSRWSPLRHRLRRVPWIAISGVFEADVKDIPTAIDTVSRLRAGGRRCRVLRISSLPLSAREREMLAPDRYLCAVPPSAVARALRGCDLALFTSRAEEGFGLPLLEAMASGVPAVASRIPSTLFMTQQAVPLVTAGDAAAFAAAAGELLDDAARWRRVRADGCEAARRFDREDVLPELLSAVRWAANAAHDVEPAEGVEAGLRIT